MVGKCSGHASVLLTFTERKTRYNFIRLIKGKDVDSVSYAIKGICAEFENLIQVIIADNGTEFTTLKEALAGIADAYYAHPHISFARRSNETHNRMIRRYSLDSISPKTVVMVEYHLNTLPRRTLKYQTPEKSFQIEAVHIA